MFRRETVFSKQSLMSLVAHPVTHENVEAARKPFLSNYCYPGALLGAPTLLAIFGTVPQTFSLLKASAHPVMHEDAGLSG